MPVQRKWWGKVALFTTLLTGAFLFVSVLLLSIPEPWSQLLPFLSCWGALLSFGVFLIALFAIATRAPLPDFADFWYNVPWALVGGVAGLTIPLSEWLWSCCYQGDYYSLGCFGPLLFLMGFALGGLMGKGILMIIAIFAAPFIGGFLAPYIGQTAAHFLTAVIMIGAVGVSLYARITQGLPGPRRPSRSFETKPGDTLADLQYWPRWVKELTIKNPPPWLVDELDQPGVAEDWLAAGPGESERPDGGSLPAHRRVEEFRD